MGSFSKSSQIMKQTIEIKQIAAAQRIQGAENQSSRCPLSRMICRVASQIAMNENPT